MSVPSALGADNRTLSPVIRLVVIGERQVPQAALRAGLILERKSSTSCDSIRGLR